MGKPARRKGFYGEPMKIILEAEVMDRAPGDCAVRLRVFLAPGNAAGQEFTQDVILRLDDVQSVFDLLMKNLARNMRDTLVSYLEHHRSVLEIPLMPVLTWGVRD